MVVLQCQGAVSQVTAQPWGHGEVFVRGRVRTKDCDGSFTWGRKLARYITLPTRSAQPERDGPATGCKRGGGHGAYECLSLSILHLHRKSGQRVTPLTSWMGKRSLCME